MTDLRGSASEGTRPDSAGRIAGRGEGRKGREWHFPRGSVLGAAAALVWCARLAGGADLVGGLGRQLASQPGNLVFSPYSVTAALTLAFAGARGETAAQMARVMGCPADLSQTLRAYKAQAAALDADARGGKAELLIGNALWGEKSLRFEKRFVSRLKKECRAPLSRVDFKGAPERARETINGWIGDKTAEHIPALIPRGGVTSGTRVVLTNAIYWKGAWESEFPKSATREEAFHVSPGDDVTAPMMQRLGDYAYAEDSDVQVVSVPYKGGAFSMMLVLPKDPGALPAIEDGLSQSRIAHWDSLSQKTKVNLAFPRFEARTQLDVAAQLSALGMTDAFLDGRADFTGITREEPIVISNVFHEAWIRANEEGSEAAAATAVVMRATSTAISMEPRTFRADHPFLFFLRHEPTGTVLFQGRVANPMQP